MGIYFCLTPVMCTVLYLLLYHPGEVGRSEKAQACQESPAGGGGRISLAKKLVEADMTVGFVVLLFECAFVELFEAE